MKNSSLKYKIGVFILLLTFPLKAQVNEMLVNNNHIDEGFVPTTELRRNSKLEPLIENEINLVLEKNKNSIHSIYVINKTADSIVIATQDWHLFLIQEAKDKKGEWKPIEYWKYSTCGNSYLSRKIKPNGILKTESLAYLGNYKTEIRFKLLNKNKVYYSNPINGFIKLKQFSIPKSVTKSERFKYIEKIGGTELSKKILFLEANGMIEYGEKRKAYLEEMIALRKNNNN